MDSCDLLIHPNAAKASCNASERSSSVYLRNLLLSRSSTISIRASSSFSQANTTAVKSWKATDRSSFDGVAVFSLMSTARTRWKRASQDSLILHSRKDMYHLHADSSMSGRTSIFVTAKENASRDSEEVGSSVDAMIVASDFLHAPRNT